MRSLTCLLLLATGSVAVADEWDCTTNDVRYNYFWKVTGVGQDGTHFSKPVELRAEKTEDCTEKEDCPEGCGDEDDDGAGHATLDETQEEVVCLPYCDCPLNGDPCDEPDEFEYASGARAPVWLALRGDPQKINMPPRGDIFWQIEHPVHPPGLKPKTTDGPFYPCLGGSDPAAEDGDCGECTQQTITSAIAYRYALELVLPARVPVGWAPPQPGLVIPVAGGAGGPEVCSDCEGHGSTVMVANLTSLGIPGIYSGATVIKGDFNAYVLEPGTVNDYCALLPPPPPPPNDPNLVIRGPLKVEDIPGGLPDLRTLAQLN